MLDLNVGDKITTVGVLPVSGVIHSFGYIPMDVNKKAFLVTEQHGSKGLIAIDLVWNEIKKI